MGFVALILAAVNIFGGFLVTARMLAMYKKKAEGGQSNSPFAAYAAGALLIACASWWLAVDMRCGERRFSAAVCGGDVAGSPEHKGIGMKADIAALLYLVSGVLFIMALKGLSSPASSRTGNRNGMIGMAIAIATTLWVAGIMTC